MTQTGIFLAKISYKPYIFVIGIDYMVFGDGESIFEVKITLGTTWKAYTGFYRRAESGILISME